jgi:hypothetical protein
VVDPLSPEELTASFPGVRLGPGANLGGSARSAVSRHRVLEGPPEWGETVVVKAFVPQPIGRGAAMGYARELAGLSLLDGTPRLLAHDDETERLVMEDLGEPPTLADLLLGRDASAARAAALAWAAALGGHVRGDETTLRAAYPLLGGAVAQDEHVREEYPRAGLARLAAWGVRLAAAATDEALAAVAELEADTARVVLSGGDACPDNALLTSTGVRFLDLEGAGLHHVAYDAAYALEPFSTCWCVFTPPGGLTERMLAAFTQAAADHVPGLGEDPRWPRQVRVAVALWVLSATLWLLEGAEADRPTLGPPGREAPSFRQLLVARWRWVARHLADELPDVAAACDEAVTLGLRRWGGEDRTLILPGYPAFR